MMACLILSSRGACRAVNDFTFANVSKRVGIFAQPFVGNYNASAKLLISNLLLRVVDVLTAGNAVVAMVFP